MQATIEQLSQIQVFGDLTPSELARLQPHTQVQRVSIGEIVMHEGEHIVDLTIPPT